MITARLHLVEGLYQGFTITGHADGAREDNEYDLICAAVSAITLTIAAGLQDILQMDGTFDSRSGFMNVDLQSHANEMSQILIETMVHGLEAIQEQYPDKLKIITAKG